MRMLGVFAIVLAVALACGTRAGRSAPWDGPAQVTSPLPLAVRAPASTIEAHARRTSAYLPASLAQAKLVVAAGRTLYFASGRESIVAVDAGTGRIRWRVDGVASYQAAASDRLLFVTSTFARNSNSSYALALSADDGRRVIARPGSWFGSTLHGFFYASGDSSRGGSAFAAYDARTGHEVWSVSGTASVGGPPVLVGTTLLQSFTESGAITVNAMHAFDVTSGRERWRAGYGPRPLGTGPGVVYLDTTWFPMQLDNYMPLGIGTVDIATGAMRHEYYYKPDRARKWPRPANATSGGATGAHVGGGFVTFRFNGSWYRYDADRDPNRAHAVRLDGIGETIVWLSDTRALVTANGTVALAQWLPDRIELHPVSPGDVQPHHASSDGGTQYVIAGTKLLAADVGGDRIRVLGALPCAHVSDLVVLDASVAVRCEAEGGASGERLVDYADPAAAAIRAGAHPELPLPPRYALSLVRLPVPPGGTSPLERQWWPSSIAAAPDRSVAMILTPGGDARRAGAIARVAPAGTVDVVALPAAEIPPHPRDAVVDAHGTIWFNEDGESTVTALHRDGTFTPFQIGAPSEPLPAPRTLVMGGRPVRVFPRRNSLGIRIAIGPDGEAWYARTHPTRAIGRVDGSKTFAVPDAIGDIVALAGGHDGGLWFLTAGAAGRVDARGGFVRIVLPGALAGTVYPPRRLVAGRANTAFVAGGKQLVEIDAQRVVRIVTLPNASSSISALTVGCDGIPYVADTLGAQLVRIAPDGSVEEQGTGLPSIDGLATASDCRLWYVGGSNAPAQTVGTFAFMPARR